jgi:hypothetical protein
MPQQARPCQRLELCWCSLVGRRMYVPCQARPQKGMRSGTAFTAWACCLCSPDADRVSDESQMIAWFFKNQASSPNSFDNAVV